MVRRMAVSPPTTTLILADSNPMGCELLAESLSQPRYGIKVVASAMDGPGVLEAVSKHQPDVILMSAVLREGPRSGINILRELRRNHHEVRAVVLLDTSERNMVVEAFRGGAKGVFFRSDSLRRLWKCIRAVHQGQIWAGSDQLQYLLEEFVRMSPLRVVNFEGKVLLTKREDQIARLVADGLTNREISHGLGVSEHTVKNCVFRVFNKLGVSTRVELTPYALGHQRAEIEFAQKSA